MGIKNANAFDNRPLNRLYQLGIPVTVSTDDPELLKVDLCGELELVSRTYGWEEQDLVQIQKNAIKATFASPEEKEMLGRKLEAFCRAEGIQ